MGSDTLEEDKKLWKKCTAGDKSAWDTLVKRYSKLVNQTIWATQRQYPNPGGIDAKDVYQDVFTKIFEKLDQWRGEASLGAWIRAIGHRTTIDHLRKQKYSYQGLRGYGEDEGTQNEPCLPDERSVDPVTKIFAKELLAKLRGPELIVIKLEFIDGWPVEEIAEFLHKKPGAIYTIKSRALEKLRKLAKKKGC
jgi:RNA polymerase sigma-70 factor (ECF subfamily)